MNIFITGSRGFLGSHLTQALLKRGVFVCELVRDAIRHNHSYANATVFGNVEDINLIERTLSDYEINTVVHLAAQTAVATGSANPIDTFRTNILGTMNVLEAARGTASVKRVVIASSDKAYHQDSIHYTEETPLGGTGPYGVSKACADLLAQTYIESYGMSIAISRCGNLYGPGHHNYSTLIPGTIKRVLDQERPVVRFGGEATRDFLYVQDAVEAYIKLMDSDETGAFNFSGGEPKRIIDIVRMILDKMDSSITPNIVEGGRGEIKNQSLDCRKARELLGWQPAVKLTDGLDNAIQYYRSHLKRDVKMRLLPKEG